MLCRCLALIKKFGTAREELDNCANLGDVSVIIILSRCVMGSPTRTRYAGDGSDFTGARQSGHVFFDLPPPNHEVKHW